MNSYKSKRQLLAKLLALCMIFSMLPLSALALEEGAAPSIIVTDGQEASPAKVPYKDGAYCFSKDTGAIVVKPDATHAVRKAPALSVMMGEEDDLSSYFNLDDSTEGQVTLTYNQETVYNVTADVTISGLFGAKITAEIQGSLKAGQQLTANVTGGSSVAYQWQRSASSTADNFTDITETTANAQKYTLTSDDVGKYIQVVITDNSAEAVKDVKAVTAGAIGADDGKTALTGVSITGTLKVGQTLTASVTPAGATADYQWVMADDNSTASASDITGATGQTYVLGKDAAGKYIGVRATGTGNYDTEVRAELRGPVEAASATAPSFEATSKYWKQDDGSTVTFTVTNAAALSSEGTDVKVYTNKDCDAAAGNYEYSGGTLTFSSIINLTENATYYARAEGGGLVASTAVPLTIAPAPEEEEADFTDPSAGDIATAVGQNPEDYDEEVTVDVNETTGEAKVNAADLEAVVGADLELTFVATGAKVTFDKNAMEYIADQAESKDITVSIKSATDAPSAPLPAGETPGPSFEVDVLVDGQSILAEDKLDDEPMNITLQFYFSKPAGARMITVYYDDRQTLKPVGLGRSLVDPEFSQGWVSFDTGHLSTYHTATDAHEYQLVEASGTNVTVKEDTDDTRGVLTGELSLVRVVQRQIGNTFINEIQVSAAVRGPMGYGLLSDDDSAMADGTTYLVKGYFDTPQEYFAAEIEGMNLRYSAVPFTE